MCVRILLPFLLCCLALPAAAAEGIPKQVRIKLKVAEVSGDVTTVLGTDLSYMRDNTGGHGNSTMEGARGLFPAPGFSGASGNLAAQTWKGGQFIFDQLKVGGHDPYGYMDLVIQALAREGLASVYANPEIRVVDGKQATIHAGDEYPYQTAKLVGSNAIADVIFKQVGVIVKVTPKIHADDIHVEMAIDSELTVVRGMTSVTFGANQQQSELPIFTTRKVITSVVASSDETIVIAGLKRVDQLHDESRVPLLGKIPIVGFFFRNTQDTKTSTELIIMITPHVILGEESFLIPDWYSEDGPAVSPGGRSGPAAGSKNLGALLGVKR